MRGAFAAPQGALEQSIANLGRARFESVTKDRLDEVMVSADAVFTESGWVFENPYVGGEYVKRFVDCNREELMDVVSVFFQKLKQVGQKEEELNKKITQLQEELALFSAPPALQLLG